VTWALFFQCWGVKNAPDEYFRVNKFFSVKVKNSFCVLFRAEVVHYLCSIRSKRHEEIFREAEWSLNEEEWIYRGNKCGKKSYGFSFVWKCIFSNSAICIPATLFRKTVVKAALSEKAATKCTRFLGRLFLFSEHRRNTHFFSELVHKPPERILRRANVRVKFMGSSRLIH